ncbi:MAG: hypothetical protein FJ308_05840 [Planctomycetes bacterium]|nr:hypothetical protein [Planctomycetota bacterium]
MASRTRPETDRRVIHVELTASRQATYELAANAKLQFHRALLGVLTEDEQEILLVLFRKIARKGWKQVERLSESTSSNGECLVGHRRYRS